MLRAHRTTSRSRGVRILLAVVLALSLVRVNRAAAVTLNEGDILVLDQGDSESLPSVLRVDPDTGEQTIVFSGGLLEEPTEVAIYPTIDDTVITVGTLHSIGTSYAELPGEQTVISEGGLLVNVTGLAVEASGNILVTNGAPPQVIRVDGFTGEQTLLSSGEGMCSADDIAVGADGAIFVLDSCSAAIFLVDADTGDATILTSGGFLLAPTNFDVRTLHPRLITFNAAPESVVSIDDSHGQQTLISEGGLLVNVTGLAVEASGNILVTNGSPAQVIRVNGVTGEQAVLASGGYLVSPVAIAVVSTSMGADVNPPVVNVSFPAPDGLNGWFVTLPVAGSVTADDTTTGGSNVTAITCTGTTTGTLTGLGTPSASASLTVSAEGINNVSCTADDSAGNSGAEPGSSNTATVKIDTGAPDVVLDPTADICSAPGHLGWCRGTQTAGFNASDAASEVASPCTGASCDFTQSTTTNGGTVTIASGPVCDVAGNCAAGKDAGPFMIDSASPTIAITSPLAGGVYLLNVASASVYGCDDLTSGMASCAGPVSSGANFDTGSVGSHAFTVDAKDGAGNVAQAIHTYSVIYDFSGFTSPVDNPGLEPPFVFNIARARSAIPVKFSLAGDQGLSIFAAGYPASQQIACDSSAPLDAIEETESAGSSSLSYDAGTDEYKYTWKTDSAWANTCRQLVMQFDDGTSYVAYFSFTR